MSAPVIGILSWRRRLPTSLGTSELYTLATDYVTALTEHGAVVLMLPNLTDADVPHVLDRIDGLVLSGGADLAPELTGAQPDASEQYDPARDATEAALLAEARRRRMPTLGICRGLQTAVVHLGGTLDGDIRVSQDHPAERFSPEASDRRHEVALTRDSWIADTLQTRSATVNSLHHQAPQEIPPDLRITAIAGDGVIEAAESTDPDWWYVGVQWHPEKMTDPRDGDHRNRLFSAFLATVTQQKGTT